MLVYGGDKRDRLFHHISILYTTSSRQFYASISWLFFNYISLRHLKAGEFEWLL